MTFVHVCKASRACYLTCPYARDVLIQSDLPHSLSLHSHWKGPSIILLCILSIDNQYSSSLLVQAFWVKICQRRLMEQ